MGSLLKQPGYLKARGFFFVAQVILFFFQFFVQLTNPKQYIGGLGRLFGIHNLFHKGVSGIQTTPHLE